ncbi:hypothetical protein P153DRAFT_369092 [Dothidotthia symphoricarpi CBS 119687]|uniref:Uncharacterized protein n=1 Tax=Dothidotthia symphoricarpi CBS 119687 TaxID=1392245 RepID=A0A6A6A5E1_9PLEO|nr:uncharacterized protein P153DRAFT_369092 [Dothidotthia symphoricarpi CBS 119687]KAF2126375.1 hypothetical protein P153DRAFT_369092 [Dothidotthia symphoricarpi CBS 119687]
MTDDTDRRVETVFGAGVDVWTSWNGTVYVEVQDRVVRRVERERRERRERKEKRNMMRRQKKIGAGGTDEKEGMAGVARIPPSDTDAASTRFPAPRPDTEASPYPTRRIVSGSFGSFDVKRPSRFDERPYRLLGKSDREKMGKSDKREKGGDGASGKLDVFKGKPWLVR